MRPVYRTVCWKHLHCVVMIGRLFFFIIICTRSTFQMMFVWAANFAYSLLVCSYFFLSKRPKVKSPSRYCEGDDPEKWFRLSFFFRFFFRFVRRLWPIQSDYCMGFLDNKGETTKFARTNDKMLMFEWCFLCAQISRKYSVLLRHTHTRARDISFCSQYLVRLMSGNQNSWPKYFP